jgi:adenosylcobinamide kinase/adenosylcobinamide-phosphate guanylyltransferase
VYIATSRRWDREHNKRIERHQAGRGLQWTTIEEETEIGQVDIEERVAVIDCVTLWLTNLFTDTDYHVEPALNNAKVQIDMLAGMNAKILIISNEIGMGGHAVTEAGRKFTELQGFTNQYIAECADEVVFMVSGIPVTIKS